MPFLNRLSESGIGVMFTFKLESALNYRKAVEEKKLVEFSEAKKKLEREKDQLEGIHREQLIIIGQFKNMQERPFHAPDIALYFSYIQLVKEKETLQQEIIQQVSQEVEILRKALLEAVKNRKIMDKVKERQFKEFKENIAAYERKMADETAVLRFVRNKK